MGSYLLSIVIPECINLYPTLKVSNKPDTPKLHNPWWIAHVLLRDSMFRSINQDMRKLVEPRCDPHKKMSEG